MLHIISILKKMRFYYKTDWNIGDFFITVDEKFEKQKSPIDENSNILYTCYRNREGYCIYEPDRSNFLDIKEFYNKEYNIINLSSIRRYKIKRYIKTDVYTNTTPAVVKVKYVELIQYNGIKYYAVYITDLDYEDEAYKDLINYSKIKGIY